MHTAHQLADRIIAVFPHKLAEADLALWFDRLSPEQYLERVEAGLSTNYLASAEDIITQYATTYGASQAKVLAFTADLEQAKLLSPHNAIGLCRRLYRLVTIDLHELESQQIVEATRQSGFTGIKCSLDRESRDRKRRNNLANRARRADENRRRVSK